MKDKLLTAMTLILFAGGGGMIGWVLLSSFFHSQQLAEVGETSCVKAQAEKTLKDDWMENTLKKGSAYKVLFNYYQCNPVQRRDLVYFRVSPPIEPVVRRVHGLPGDKFEVLEADSPNTFHLKINGEFVMAGPERFYFNSSHVPPLKTYELSRRGVLDKNEYIIFADKPPGLSDSSNLGIVKITAFEGKVIL